MRRRLVSAQLSNKFGYCPLYTFSIVFLVHKTQQLTTWPGTSLHLPLAAALLGQKIWNVVMHLLHNIFFANL